MSEPAENFVVATTDEVFEALRQERAFQDKKWGPITRRQRQVPHYLAVIRSLLCQAEMGYVQYEGNNHCLDEVRKLAAVAVACLEEHGVVYRVHTESGVHFSTERK